jgi:hypothetical protein
LRWIRDGDGATTRASHLRRSRASAIPARRAFRRGRPAPSSAVRP